MEEVNKVEETTEQAPAQQTQVVETSETQTTEDTDTEKVEALQERLEQAEHVIETLKKSKKKKVVDEDDDLIDETPEERDARLRQIAKEEAQAIQDLTREEIIKKQGELIAQTKRDLKELKATLASKKTISKTPAGSGQKIEPDEQDSEVPSPDITRMMANRGYRREKGQWVK